MADDLKINSIPDSTRIGTYIYRRLPESSVVFAYDEYGDEWFTNGYIDLTQYGFKKWT